MKKSFVAEAIGSKAEVMGSKAEEVMGSKNAFSIKVAFIYLSNYG
jgi:hypothetical protein